MSIDFGDSTPDDAFDADDAKVDWSRVAEVQEQVDEINAVTDDQQRLELARTWAQQLGGS